jgi:hypothetical protein
MTESQLLVTASVAMLCVSLAAAALLLWLSLGAGWVVLGATIAGIAVYVAFYVLRSKVIGEEPMVEDQ